MFFIYGTLIIVITYSFIYNIISYENLTSIKCFDILFCITKGSFSPLWEPFVLVLRTSYVWIEINVYLCMIQFLVLFSVVLHF
jgi:hypothetical protein